MKYTLCAKTRRARAPRRERSIVTEFAYEHLVKSIPDYPEPGIVFKDITPLIADKDGLAATVDSIAERFKDAGITKVLGAEARGFVVAAPVAYRLGVGFVPARKPGKLPRETYCESYTLEYGTSELQVHTDAMNEDDVVLIVDDLVATGGTVMALVNLAQRMGARVAGAAFLLELAFLHPRELITNEADLDFFSLIKID